MSEMENNSGVFMAQENAADAAQLAPETGTENDGEAFSDFTGAEPESQEPQAQEAPAKEPGWIKGRVDKAVQRAVRETEERMRSEFEARFAPFRERMLDEQAEQLVKDGEFKSIERAKEYVRLKGGVTPEETANAQQAQPAQPASEAPNPHLQLLAKQADKLMARGIDVMDVFRNDERIRNAVLSGQMDFYDVAENVKPQRRMPSAVRNANNASAGSLDIRNMSDAQFQKLQRDLAAGKKFDLRR